MNIGLSKINFGITPLFNVKLKKRINNAYQNVDARICELNPHDKSDQKIMNELAKEWNSDNDPFSIFGVIKANFDNFSQEDKDKIHMGYYVTELVDNTKKTSQNIMSVIEFTKPISPKQDMIYINSLQTNPHIINEYIPPVKGAGTLAMYTAVKFAKMFSAANILLESCANGFYQQIGLKETPKDSVFTLNNKDFDTFLKRTEEKYSFQ